MEPLIGKPVSKVQTEEVADDVAWWFCEIDRGLKLRKKQATLWNRNERFLTRAQWRGDEVGELVRGSGDEMTVNKLGAYIRTRVSLLAYKNPMPKFTPRTAAGYESIPVPMINADGTPALDEMGQVKVNMIPRHKVAEGLVRDIVSQPMFGLTETTHRLTKAGDLAYGCLKVGYRPEFETDPEPDEKEQKVKVKDGRLDFGMYERNKVDGSLIVDGGRLVEKKDIPTWEEWFIDWTNHHHIIMDPDCQEDTSQARWIVQEIIRPLTDVKDDPLYKKSVRSKVQGTGDDDLGYEEGDEPVMYRDEAIKERRKRVRLFEIWDRIDQRLIVLADGCGEKLRDVPMPDGVYDDPYAFYRNNVPLGEWYNDPIACDLVPIAMEFNYARQMQSRAMKNSTRKIFTDERALEDLDIETLKSDEDMALIKVKTAAITQIGGMDKALMPYVPPMVHPSIWENIQQIDKDFWEVGGMPPEAAGSPKSKTATQVEEMSAHSGARVRTDRAYLGQCWRVAYKKLYDSIQAHMTRERAIQIMGPEGSLFTGLVDRDMIVGDYDIDVDVEDLGPTNDAMQVAQFQQMLQVIAQDPMPWTEQATVETVCDMMGIKHEGLVQALVKTAQMSVAMLAQQAAGPPTENPEAGPPTSQAQAAEQTAAGGQAKNMQGSR